MPATLAPGIRNGSIATPRPGANLASRFTLNGGVALELHLSNVCTSVLTGIARIIPASELAGIALGGGYGRGEGGVLKTPLGDEPYNDLEFYILVRGHALWSRLRHEKLLQELSERLSLSAGVELEFKITSQAQLRRDRQSLFYHDLLMGHRWVLGDDSLFTGCEHHRDARTIPLSEATRLLMNRCSGLLFARQKLAQERFSAEDADFVGRNITKTRLALGDAVLIALGKYHWSCLERGYRLGSLAAKEDMLWIEEVRQGHAAGIEFKLQPHRSALSRVALLEQLRSVRSLALKTWLWLESRRLGGSFLSPGDYVSSGLNKWPDTGGWRNRLANARVFGAWVRPLSSHRRHPRERILNALTLLLWGQAGTSPELAKLVRRELLVAEPGEMVAAYRERWSRAS